MKKILSLLVPLFLIAAVTAGNSFAKEKTQFKGPDQHMRGGGMKGGRGSGGDLGIPHGRWWQRAKVKEKLQLSEKQTGKFETISRNGRKDMIKLRAELETLTVDLEPIIDAKKFDRAAAEKILAKMESVRAKMAKQRIDMLLDMREVLTHGQYLKLKEIRGSGRRGKSKQRARAGDRRRGPRGGSEGRRPL